VATDVRVLSNKQEILNAEAIAVNQDPLGLAGDIRANFTNGGQVWSKVLKGNTWAVILYNSNILYGTMKITVEWSKHLPGWPKGKTLGALRDIWTHQNIGTFPNSYTSAYLSPHQVQFLIVA